MTATETTLSDLRSRVADALSFPAVVPPDATVLVDVVDSVTPPAYLLVWGTPWIRPSTFCLHVARLDVVCIAGRLDPAPGVETLEAMLSTAAVRLRAAGLVGIEVGPPGPFTIGGIQYLAARLTIEERVALRIPTFPGEGAVAFTARASLAASGAATIPVVEGAVAFTATADLAASGVATTAPPVWSPAQLPGLALWFDADDAATITTIDNPLRVIQIDDKSPHGRNWAQGDANLAPLYGVTTLNGRKTMYLPYKQLPGPLPANDTARFFAAVMVREGGGSSSLIAPYNAAFPQGQEWRPISDQPGGQDMLQAGETHYIPPSQSPWPTAAGTAWAPMMAYADGTLQAYRRGEVDGSTMATAYHAGGLATTHILTGCADSLAELVVVDGPVSDEDRVALWDYFVARYGDLL